MIKVTTKKSSTFIDRPKIETIFIEENTPAIEHITDNGEKVIITARQLYDLHKNGSYYTRLPTELEDQVTGEFFVKWIEMKYLSKDFSRLIEVSYAIV